MPIIAIRDDIQSVQRVRQSLNPTKVYKVRVSNALRLAAPLLALIHLRVSRQPQSVYHSPASTCDSIQHSRIALRVRRTSMIPPNDPETPLMIGIIPAAVQVAPSFAAAAAIVVVDPHRENAPSYALCGGKPFGRFRRRASSRGCVIGIVARHCRRRRARRAASCFGNIRTYGHVFVYCR